MTIRNPATGAMIARRRRSDARRRRRGGRCARAKRSTPGSGRRWRRRGARRSSTRWRSCIAERAAELALLEVRDNGKSDRDRERRARRDRRYFEFYAGAATKNYGETMPPPLPTYLANTVREPVGVVGAIVPWNFPLLLASWKVAPALAAGCTIVLKPASVDAADARSSWGRSRSKPAFPKACSTS